MRRTSHEVRGLKPGHLGITVHLGSRTSHEVRGLKLSDMSEKTREKFVAPHTRCVD